MSEICNVSKKQLRYYDSRHILSPSFRDENTSYRYYTQEQVEEVLLIQELRLAGFSLSSIGRLLKHRRLPSLRVELQQNIFQARKELEDAQRRYDAAVSEYMRISDATELLENRYNTKIEIVEFQAASIAYTRYVSDWNANFLFISRRSELYKVAEEYSLDLTGPNMAIFHTSYMKQFSPEPIDSKGDLEICIRIAGQRENCPNSRKLQAFKAVSTLYFGHYRHMKECYLSLEKWAEERNIKLSGQSLEEYIVGATMTENSNNYITRIYLPLQGYRL